MSNLATIPHTQLANHPQQTLAQVRHGRPVLVEDHGEPQVAIIDARDYHLLQAVAHYRTQPPAPAYSPTAVPQGLDEADLPHPAHDTEQFWVQIVSAYLDGHISLGRAAVLLGESRMELAARFTRLGIPLRLATTSIAEGQAEYTALR